MIKKYPEATTGCGCMVALLAFNVTAGSVAFSYAVWVLVAKTLPWWADVVGGLLFGEFAMPFAGFMWFLSWFGVHGPLFR